jgi:SAM-dependent methyltransferase
MWHVPAEFRIYMVDRRRRSLERAHCDVAPIRVIEECTAAHCTFWIGEFRDSNQLPKTFNADNQEFRRLLDHFYIPTTIDTPLAIALFDACAGAYERLVDVQRNQGNIQRLLRIAIENGPRRTPLRVLDFGCGTGLAHEAIRLLAIEKRTPVNLIGTDRSVHMLELASRRGLQILSEDAWLRTPEMAFDAVIASYVIHLGLTEEDCIHISRQLTVGGVLVANYHHATVTDLNRTTVLCESVGLEPLSIPSLEIDKSNPILIFRRPVT